VTEATTLREIERKLTVGPRFRMPNLELSGASAITKQAAFTLSATYYDTEDLRLARSGITLRRRTGGHDAGWHLKLPVDPNDAGVRDEVQLPLSAGGPGRIPAELADLVLGVTRGGELTARATQRTRRTPTVVHGRDGQPDLEIVTDSVSLTAGPLAGTAYREVEVEVLGSAELMGVVIELLQQAGAEPSRSKSKGVRAVAGDVALDPVVAPIERARPKDSAAYAVTQLVRTHVHALLAQDIRVRRALPDSVHQFRVAARRLRSGLQAFVPLVDETWARQLRAELGWIAGVLGAARDREVLEQRLFAGVRELSWDLDRAAAFVVIQDHMEAELALANQQINETLRSQRYLDLLDALIEAAAAPPTTDLAELPASEALRPLVRKRWKRLAHEANMLHDEVHGHDDHWHQTRITAKKARYTVDACAPVFGSPARKLGKQLEVVTELLGEHQDCAIAADLVHSLLTRDTGPQAAFALGALYAQQRERTQQIRHEFIEAWPRISHSEWREWLKVRPKP